MNWISVKDQLPKKGILVLGTQYEYLKKANPRYFQVMIYQGDFWFDDMGQDEIYTPTHWMRIPEPPK